MDQYAAVVTNDPVHWKIDGKNNFKLEMRDGK
jgi:hypothetical protein